MSKICFSSLVLEKAQAYLPTCRHTHSQASRVREDDPLLFNLPWRKTFAFHATVLIKHIR